jgi:hypothetical protein
MPVATAYSNQVQVSKAVAELRDTLSATTPKMVVYFASPVYDPHDLSAMMKRAFPGATVFGCSSSGEIISGKMLKKSVVAMSFDSDIIEDVAVCVVPRVGTSENVRSAFSSFANYYHTSVEDFDHDKYVGIVLIDGLSLAEERVIEQIGDVTNVIFIGGSAGDDMNFVSTYVFANGEAHTDSAILALIKPRCHFSVIKTQSFDRVGKQLIPTKIDERTRTIYEFNGKQAALAYADAIGQPVDKLPDYFMKHPLGIMAEGEPFVRSPQRVRDGSVVFYCNVKTGMELEVLKSTDIIMETRNALREKEAEMGSIKAILNFNCILRTLELEHEGLTGEYGRIFESKPTVGFSTYGESYLGHINQTATMLVFGDPKP